MRAGPAAWRPARRAEEAEGLLAAGSGGAGGAGAATGAAGAVVQAYGAGKQATRAAVEQSNADGGDGPADRGGREARANGRGHEVAAEAQVERTYGNWRRPRPPGLWHLGLISSVLLIVGLIASIIVIALVGLIPGLVLLALMLPVFLVTLRPDPHGQTPMQRVGTRLGWRRARRARSHLYRSGPARPTPYGTFQLPGVLAASQLSEARDSYDRPFAVLVPSVDAAPDGGLGDGA